MGTAGERLGGVSKLPATTAMVGNPVEPADEFADRRNLGDEVRP